MFRKWIIKSPKLTNIRQTATIRKRSTDFVLSEEVNDKGVFTLNRPKALNAINYEMIEKIHDQLVQWQKTKSLVLIKSHGCRAFSAGGDIRSLSEGNSISRRNFLRIEFTTNHLIGTLIIPYVALIDGITMGAGAGLSVHGKYRVATERTVFAMPETVIGFLPDVGGSYFLTRMTGKLGWYLGLTSARLKGVDVLKAGIATHYCDSSKIQEVERAVLELKNVNELGHVLDELCPVDNSSEFSLDKHLDQINKCFDAPTIEDILANLEQDKSEWAEKTIQTLRTVSPTSLKITKRQLDIGAKSTLAQCLQTEFRLGSNLFEYGDFHEGVRARIIAKDNAPKWNPARVEDVTDEYVQSFFRPLPGNDELILDDELLDLNHHIRSMKNSI